MILVDDRVGSKDLLRLFPKGTAQLTKLQFGDLSFLGNGPDGPIPIGVERKRLTDLVNSMYTDRLASHQIPGMLRHYRRIYLVIEGIFQVQEDGLVYVWGGRNSWKPLTTGGKGRVMATQIWGFLQTLEEMAGVQVVRTQNAKETAAWAYSVARWWEKEYAKHESHMGIKRDVQFTLRKQVPLRMRVAAELPGIGVKRCRKVADHFGSVREMVLATRADWAAIDGIGDGIADKVVKEMHKGDS